MRETKSLVYYLDAFFPALTFLFKGNYKKNFKKMSFAYPINNRQDAVTTVLKFLKDSAVSGLCNTTILRKT